LKKLLDLEKENQPIKIIAWGYHELRQIVFSLSGSDIALLLGPPLSRQDILGVQFLDLKVVVLNIAGQQPVSEPEIRPVSADKLATNALSVEVEMMLKLGMLRADRVREFFANWPDPLLGDRVASAFKQEYSRLSDSGITPDDIFAELLAFAGGTRRTSLKHEAAVLAVLAYLFEQCDIFEESYRDGL
jgi:outer membrane PBP1 activator LpoA protein